MKAGVRICLASLVNQARMNINNPTYFFLLVIQPALVAVVACLVYTHGDMHSDLSYAILGAGMIGVWSSNLAASGMIIEGERRYNTLEFLLASPAPLFVVLFGKALSIAVMSMVSPVSSVTAAWLLFGTGLKVAHPAAFISAAAASIAAVMAVSLLLGALYIVVPYSQRLGDLLFPLYMLSGLLFPLGLLPVWTRPLSYMLPLTWGARLFRDSAAGAGWDMLLPQFGVLLIITGTCFIVAWQLFKVVIHRARVEATLGRRGA